MNTQQHDLTGQLHGVQRRDLTSQQQELGIEQLGVKSQLNDTANQHCNIASLSSSLSITSPAVSVATTASASSSVSTHEESSQRHFQHSLPRDRQTSHMSKVLYMWSSNSQTEGILKMFYACYSRVHNKRGGGRGQIKWGKGGFLGF